MKLYTQFGRREWLISAFTVVTAVIHLFLGVSFGDVLFILNGAGYLGLLVLYLVDFNFLPVPRSLIRWGFIAFTALTIILYFVMQFTSLSPFGIADKIVELVLVYALWTDADA